jgi:mannose-1-phosphate guanylyltransferase/mannose-1-phosphate guanylyltransferase/mannose-6-phosphate isomerase
MGAESLFQASARRLSGPDFAPPMVITNADFRFIVTEQLAAAGIDPGPVLIEPQGRNTGPAVLAAALWLARQDPQALMLVAPSDHVIPDTAAFRAALQAGTASARAGQMVTFGITPTHAETGYGWLELDVLPGDTVQALDLIRYVEKPDAEKARFMLDQGRFLWNAGIFLFSVQTILDAFRSHAPDMFAPVEAAINGARTDLGFVRLAPAPWGQAPEISIDYAVMERAGNLSVVPFSGGWSDLGDWQAVWQEMPCDGDGVATSGAALAIDCHDSLLRSEAEGLQLVGIGLDGIMAVAMPDAVLIADKSRAQDVKLAVTNLKSRGVKQSETFPKDHRPWGWFETLVLANRFQVKRIVVHPGASLSLQSHHHRSEHWIVVAGTAQVTIGDDVRLISENQSVYVPLGAKHRLQNPGKVDMVLIEVQTGSYLGEDDITRYEDVYARE